MKLSKKLEEKRQIIINAYIDNEDKGIINTMEIYTPSRQLVVCIKEQGELKFGDVCLVAYTKVSAWNTEVYLVGFDSIFNPCHFINLEIVTRWEILKHPDFKKMNSYTKKYLNIDFGKELPNDILFYKDLEVLEIKNTYTEFFDLSPLKDLPKLKELYLGYNKKIDLSTLKDLSNLTHLGLSSSNITDISSLSVLTNLQYLNLSHNEISDLSPLKDLINLQDLNLSHNEISDISPLKNLTDLISLSLPKKNNIDLSLLKDKKIAKMY